MAVPYIRDINTELTNIFKPQNLKVPEKIKNNLANKCFAKCIPNNNKLSTPNVVRKIGCLNCDNTYIVNIHIQQHKEK